MMGNTLTATRRRKTMALGRMESFDHGLFIEFLEASGKTQAELAVECGVTKGVVSHWLSGRNKPAPQHVPLLAQTLGVSVLDLAGKTIETADLVDLRIVQGLFGSRAAELAGLKPSQLQTLEAAISMPKPEQLEALAGPYKVTIDQIKRAWVNRRIYFFGVNSLQRLTPETREYLSPWSTP